MMKAQAKPMIQNRRALADKAMKSAITARLMAGKDLVNPVCIYSVAEAHGVRVTFNDINMEGMYQRGSPPRIHLSSLRPLTRRIFNCAHELGHHLLGHGSSIDELRENQTVRPWDAPEEYGANTFAACMLMPTLGIRNAFAVRGLTPESATPVELLRIACQFGVGYSTLVTHLRWGEALISHARAEALCKFTPRTLRAQVLGSLTPQPLIIADEAWSNAVIDAEVGHLMLLPTGAIAQGNAVVAIADMPNGRLFEARHPGLARLQLQGGGWAAFARVARKEYVGRPEFRHLEEAADDEV